MALPLKHIYYPGPLHGSQHCHGKWVCITQWSYEPCCAWPPKVDRSYWRVLTKHGQLEEEMATHSSIRAWRPYGLYEKAKRYDTRRWALLLGQKASNMLLGKWKWKSLSHVWLFATPWTMYSPRNSPGQNTGVGSLSLLQRISHPGIESRSPGLQADSLPAEPWGKPKNTGVGSLFLLQQIFLAQESNWGLLYCRQILYQTELCGEAWQAITNSSRKNERLGQSRNNARLWMCLVVKIKSILYRKILNKNLEC